MRIDKFLKVSRLVKRRSVAAELVDKNRVLINDKVAKKSTIVKVGDIILLKFGSEQTRYLKVRVLKVLAMTTKEDALTMYEVLEE